MSPATKRSIFRWLHIALGLPILGYVYSPFEELHTFAPMVRYFFLPALILSGLWMWKGQAVKNLFTKRTA